MKKPKNWSIKQWNEYKRMMDKIRKEAPAIAYEIDRMHDKQSFINTLFSKIPNKDDK